MHKVVSALMALWLAVIFSALVNDGGMLIALGIGGVFLASFGLVTVVSARSRATREPSKQPAED